MANKSIFKSASTSTKNASQNVNTVNDAGGIAYLLSDKSALAQLAVTGTFNETFYATGPSQIQALLELLSKVDATYVAKLAVYARQNGKMKDMPTALLAHLAATDTLLFNKVFDRVCDNGKQVKNFVQMIRSGQFGRKSFGTSIKRTIRKWFDKRSDERLLNDTVGNNPSLADVIRLVRPVPKNPSREAFYAWIIGRKTVRSAKEMTYRTVGDRKIAETVLYSELPACVREFEDFKAGTVTTVPKVDFRLLTSTNLTTDQWAQVARNADFNMIRQNINTFARQGVLETVAADIAAKLSDRDTVKRVKLLPYQLLTTFQNIEESTPSIVKNALQDAMEYATENVPSFEGKAVYVFPDVSGSMQSPATGYNGTATSKTTCLDIAGLVSACLMRSTKNCTVIPFDTSLHNVQGFNPRDSVMTNASKLAKFGGGGTHCALPMADVANKGKKVDLIIYVSDNASWADIQDGRTTETTTHWRKIKAANPDAKLICIDIQRGNSTQVQDSNSVMNIGGFSDSIWETIKNFVDGTTSGANSWVQEIEKIDL